MITSFVNTWFTYRLLKIISQPWESTPAFKVGVIDKDGKLIKSPQTDAEKKAYTSFDRIGYNIKRTLSKVPGSQNPFVRMASAVALLREGALLESDLEEICDELDPVEEDTPTNTSGGGHVAMEPVPLLRKPVKRKKLGETLNFPK